MKLGVKIGLVTSAVVMIMGVLTVFVIHRLVQQTFEEQTNEKGNAIVRLVAEEVANPLLDKDWFSVQKTLEGLKDSNQIIEYAYVKGLEEGLVVHTFPSGFPHELVKFNSLGNEERYRIQGFVSEKGRIEDVGFRILDGMPFELHIGISQSPVESLLAKTTWSIILLTFQGVILGVLAISILSHYITKPLQGLTRQALTNSQIELSQPFYVSGNDEVGDLAKAFNLMMEKIRKYVDDLQTSKETVVRRNHELLLLNRIAQDIGGRVEVSLLLERAIKELIKSMNLEEASVLLFSSGLSLNLKEFDYKSLSTSSSYFCWGNCEDYNSEAVRKCGLSFGDFWKILDNREIISILKYGHLELYPHKKMNNSDPCLIAVIPLIAHDQVLGMLSVRKFSSLTFDKTDITTLTTIGRQLGVAIANRWLWEKLEDREGKLRKMLNQIIHAQEDERKRIARELHDETSQALTALSFGLKTTTLSITNDPIKGVKHLDLLREQLNRIILEIQKIIYDLRPSMLDDLGLLPAIRWLATNRLNQAGINFQIAVKGSSRRLSAEVETTLYRIVQESLMNVIKYSKGKTVQIELIFNENTIEVVVDDDGVGFEPNKVLNGKRGLGIMGMRERAELLGGKLEISSQLGNGTQIHLVIPVENRIVDQNKEDTP